MIANIELKSIQIYISQENEISRDETRPSLEDSRIFITNIQSIPFIVNEVIVNTRL
jgi:hypothetical protein